MASPAIANGVGRLTEVRTATTRRRYTGFDAVGRVVKSEQSFLEAPQRDYAFEYGWDMGGWLSMVKYPSGRVVNYAADAGGRVNRAANAAGTAWALVNEFAAHGAAKKVTLGNGVVEKWTWNPGRLQARRLRVGTETAAEQVGKLEWSYCGGGGAESECASNNGNVMAQWVQPLNEEQSFGYDSRNRLASALGRVGATVKWSETLEYDVRGNRWVKGARVGLPGLTALTPQSSAAYSARNRVAAWSYDAAGNVLSLGASTGEYDGENWLWRRTNTVTGRQSSYLYDGEGRRVRKTDGTDVWYYVYDAAGKLAAEYGPAGPVGGTQYVTQDHLGSTWMVTGAGGTVVKRYDYLPFGEALLAGTGTRTAGQGYETADDVGAVRQRFTSKERDAETGLDYFLARYYSGLSGRFTSPDAPFADQYPDDPPSWNLYSYGRNNPLKYVDTDGHAAWLVGGLVGAGMDIAVQTVIEGKSVSQIDVGSVLISAGAGAVGGGLAVKAGKLAPLAKQVLEGAIDATGSVAQQVYKTGKVSLTETAIDVAGGRAVGAVVGNFAESAAKNSSEVKQLVKEADRKSRIASNAEAAGNASSAARRNSQVTGLNAQAADRVASRSTAASTASSQAASAAAKRAVDEARRREERKRQGGGL